MKYILLIFGFLPVLAYAQVQDNFENGLPEAWVQSPEGRWCVDTTGAISGLLSLHHCYDNSESDQDFIFRDISDLHPELSVTTWNFKLKYAYSPSSSNNWNLILMADADPAGSNETLGLSGFIAGLNYEGYDDTLKIWKVVDGEPEVLMKSSLNWQEDIETDSIVHIRISRSPAGEWDLCICDENNAPVMIGSAYDPELFGVRNMGISYKYTSGKDRLLWLDDISLSGTWLADTTGPYIDTCYINSYNSLAMIFSEPLDTSFLRLENFMMIPGDIPPSEIMIKSTSEIWLVFAESFRKKEYFQAKARELCDMNDNISSSEYDSLILLIPEWGDVIITEIMADPDPVLALPEAEYIEVLNMSDFDFSPSVLGLGKSGFYSGLSGNTIRRGEYSLLVNENDVSLFSNIENIITSSKSFNLNNVGDLVLLCDSSGNTIHGVEYEKSWYNNELKQEGGWTLEMKDSSNPFYGKANWTASVSKTGGSPGTENTVRSHNSDTGKPEVENAYPLTDNQVSISFSETIRLRTQDIFLQSGIQKIIATDSLRREYLAETIQKLEDGKVYELNIEGSVTDESGNFIGINSFRFGLTDKADAGDLLFNEILFDPWPSSAEFIEFVNSSEKILDVKDYFIVTVNEERSDTGKPAFISDVGRCLLPGGIYTITTDRQSLIDDYTSSNPDNIFETGSIPALPDNKSTLLLYNRQLELIDRLVYDKTMHNDLLSGTTGISLERVVIPGTSTASHYWVSAVASSGYATPGAENSYQPGIETGLDALMELSGRRISPDSDGFEDLLYISVNTEWDECIVSLRVFNDLGFHERIIAENTTMSGSAGFIWDGRDDTGKLLKEGIYILWLRLIGPEGQVLTKKKVCAVLYPY